jgi:rhodanese-related sulfurtransferase
MRNNSDIIMKKILLLLLLMACSDKRTESSLSPEDFNSKYRNTPEAIMLDVRTQEELKEGMIAGAQNIVYDDSFENKIGNLSKDAPIFVYCAAGVRSEKAARILKDKGFKEVYQLKGGLNAWKEAKMPL